MRDFGDAFQLTLLTNDPSLALIAERSGIDRVGVDLEILGKAQRQSGVDGRMSYHQISDLAAVGEVINRAALFVRINPLNPETAQEVEAVLACGARVIMLPYFRSSKEVDAFVRLVDGRADCVILVETAPAVARIREILAVDGLHEAMVGLNDLRIEMGVHSHFELLASPLLKMIAEQVCSAGLHFSVGGVTHAKTKNMLVDPDLVLAQYPRLGATGAWISRSFVNSVKSEQDFACSISQIRKRLTEWSSASEQMRQKALDQLAQVARINS